MNIVETKIYGCEFLDGMIQNLWEKEMGRNLKCKFQQQSVNLESTNYNSTQLSKKKNKKKKKKKNQLNYTRLNLSCLPSLIANSKYAITILILQNSEFNLQTKIQQLKIEKPILPKGEKKNCQFLFSTIFSVQLLLI
eukprot:TRINITY_DN11843_c0_g1_i1.p3 TRINITY_DN11843_c0_g1~~TRINITY_DN11843_c0_g1_i1.p3  ORF type:complete len:137 (+),score=10.93 TRINITY_DN11843_c0_g1_i1:724-1134(+)